MQSFVKQLLQIEVSIKLFSSGPTFRTLFYCFLVSIPFVIKKIPTIARFLVLIQHEWIKNAAVNTCLWNVVFVASHDRMFPILYSLCGFHLFASLVWWQKLLSTEQVCFIPTFLLFLSLLIILLFPQFCQRFSTFVFQHIFYIFMKDVLDCLYNSEEMK